MKESNIFGLDADQVNLAKKIGLCCAGLLGISVLISSVYITPTGYCGIRRTFSVIGDNCSSEGIHLKAPFITSVDNIKLKEIQQDFKLNNLLTSDLQPVHLEYKITYSLTEKQAVSNAKNVSGDVAEIFIRPRANEAILDAVAQLDAAAVNKTREKIKETVLEKLTKHINDKATIRDVAITKVDIGDEEFKEAIQKKVVAGQNLETARINRSKALVDAETEINKAKGEAEATRIKNEVVKSEKDVSRLWIEKWDGHLPDTLVGNSSGVLLNLKQKQQK